MPAYEIEAMLREIEVATETAMSEIAAYGTNYETAEPVPWHEVEPADDEREHVWREMYELEIAR